MQIRPITSVSYKNQNAQQNNNQQSFGMATTTRMKKAIATNMAEILANATKKESKVIEQLCYIEKHPLTVGWTGQGDELVIITDKAKSKCHIVEITSGNDFATAIDKTVQDLHKHDKLETDVKKAGVKVQSLGQQLDKAMENRKKYTEATTKRLLAGKLNDKEALEEAHSAMTSLEETVESAERLNSAANMDENNAYAYLAQFFRRDNLPENY